ncbi:hypothetical protein [Nocardia sp. BMG111209]|uniref:hypothetical protein n=1 Tax=Nocardia sp. BMG111209 TaxID=1160137 RepID=UPI0012DF4FBA|nr:hypothetical protein [Nocardia sp. BMG111209]
MILPGAGGFIGAAAGSVADDWINGNLHGFGDVAESAAMGAGAQWIGGKVGAKLLGKFAPKITGAVDDSLLGTSKSAKGLLWQNFKWNKGLLGDVRNGADVDQFVKMRYAGKTFGGGVLDGLYSGAKWAAGSNFVPGMGGGGDGGSNAVGLGQIPTQPLTYVSA